jgi:hypothetical protein
LQRCHVGRIGLGRGIYQTPHETIDIFLFSTFDRPRSFLSQLGAYGPSKLCLCPVDDVCGTSVRAVEVLLLMVPVYYRETAAGAGQVASILQQSVYGGQEGTDGRTVGVLFRLSRGVVIYEGGLLKTRETWHHRGWHVLAVDTKTQLVDISSM